MAKADLIYRFTEIERGKINREARTVPLSFSSEYPALQRAGEDALFKQSGLKPGDVYVEILDHSPENVDLSLLNNRGAFLDEHDDKDQIGVVESAVIDGAAKISRALAKMDTHAKAEMRLGQMEANSRPHISAGYKYTRFIGDDLMPDGRKAKRFAWRAMEVSSVAVPADPTIGVARNYKDLAPIVDLPKETNVEAILKTLTPEQKRSMKTILLAPDSAAGAAAVIDEATIKTRSDAAMKIDRERGKQIRAIADFLIKDHGKKNDGQMETAIRALADEALGTDMEVGAFQMRAMQDIFKAKPAVELTMAKLGLNEREQKQYSIMRAVQSVLRRCESGNRTALPDGLEGETHAALLKAERDAGGSLQPQGFLVPADAPVRLRDSGARMQRDLVAGNFGNGGASVATDLQVPIIEILRNKMVTTRAGVRMLSGLQGNIVIPRQTAAGTAYSLAETAAVTVSTQVLDQVALSPKRVAAEGRYSKQLLIQSSIDVENFVRDDLLKVIAIDGDRLVLNGQGAASEMLGIMNTPGIGSVTFAAAATFAKLVAFETTCAAQNVILDPATTAYLTTPAAKGVLKSAAKLLVGATTVAAEALWNNDRINGYRADDSNQIPNNQMLFGDFSQFIVAMWGGLDIVVDPYTLASNAEVRIIFNTFMDGVARHPQAFCLSPDSAAQ